MNQSSSEDHLPQLNLLPGLEEIPDLIEIDVEPRQPQPEFQFAPQAVVVELPSVNVPGPRSSIYLKRPRSRKRAVNPQQFVEPLLMDPSDKNYAQPEMTFKEA